MVGVANIEREREKEKEREMRRGLGKIGYDESHLDPSPYPAPAYPIPKVPHREGWGLRLLMGGPRKA